MKFIKLVHPEAGEGLVPASAVRHWESSGWSPADETPKAAQDPPADPAPGAEATPARRRTPKESE